MPYVLSNTADIYPSKSFEINRLKRVQLSLGLDCKYVDETERQKFRFSYSHDIYWSVFSQKHLV